MSSFNIKFLGTRGTIASDGARYALYGGATSCVYVKVDAQTIVLDGGSGILSLPEVIDDTKTVHLLISHMHIDHIKGVMACPIFFDPNFTINIYAVKRHGRDVKEQLECAMSPPLWPVNSDAFSANVNFITCEEDFYIGNLRVRCLDGAHPGGSTVYRLECCEKSLVYATDYEIEEKTIASLIDFAKGCDLLLCDGQYTTDEMDSKRGYGHSAWQDAALVALQSDVKRLGIIHHDPYRTDIALDEMQKELKTKIKNAFFAHRGEEIHF